MLDIVRYCKKLHSDYDINPEPKFMSEEWAMPIKGSFGINYLSSDVYTTEPGMYNVSGSACSSETTPQWRPTPSDWRL